jgi:DNA polymerase theta
MRLIPLVLIEIPSYHKKHHHQQQQQQSSCYQLLPAHHLYRVHSNVLPCPKEFQLLQKATTLPPSSQLPPSVTPLHHQYSNYFSPYFSEYASLQKKYQIRQSFIASPGYILLTADYSQIELRLLTHFCKEENLLAAFNQSSSSLIENNQNHPNQKKKKEDIFERLASIYKRKPIESITKVERNEIKQLCYAVIYGAGSKLIAENMNISTEEAKQLIADFHKRFPSIQRFINELYEECAEKGYVETLFGRKRYLSFEKVIIDPKNKKDENNWKILSKLQRQVINSLCQGSAADLVKVSTIN